MKILKRAALAALTLICPSANADQWTGHWSPQFSWPIIPIHSSLLPNGKVLTFGTTNNGTQQAFNYDLWSPGIDGAGEHQTLFHGQPTDIFCSASNLLPEGNVIFGGGDTRVPESNGIRDSLQLDFRKSLMTRNKPMQFARWYPTFTTLPNGETLIAGGRDLPSQPIQTPEIFDGENWRTLWGATSAEITDDIEHHWYFPRNFVAPDGRVFGLTADLMYYIDWRGEGAVEVAGRLPNESRSFTSTAVMYEPGRILQVGGSVAGDVFAKASHHAIVVDLNSGTPVVSKVDDMSQHRAWANATVLANGEVFISGGSAFENRLGETSQMAEMWNPKTKKFRQLKPAATPRLYHSSALLLPDGSVLAGGGGSPGPLTNLNAEIYYPPYLYKDKDFATRPEVGNFNLAQNYGNKAIVPVSGAGEVARVTFVRTGAVTHSFDQSQRFLELSFRREKSMIVVDLPTDPNIAPPGFYQLFVLNEAGVPSMAKIVSLNQKNPQGAGGFLDLSPKPDPALNEEISDIPENMALGSGYTLRARHSGKCIDAPGDGLLEDGLSLIQWDCRNSPNQTFRLENAGRNGFRLVNVKTEKCIDSTSRGTADGTPVQQWECNGSPSQTFRFVKAPHGSYKLRFDASAKCLDIQAFGMQAGAEAIRWTCDFANNGNQDFFFQPN